MNTDQPAAPDDAELGHTSSKLSYTERLQFYLNRLQVHMCTWLFGCILRGVAHRPHAMEAQIGNGAQTRQSGSAGCGVCFQSFFCTLFESGSGLEDSLGAGQPMTIGC